MAVNFCFSDKATYVMPDHLDLWGLFLSAFISATLFPGGSEAVLAALAYLKQHDPWWLLAIATLGNTLGGLSTFLLGWWLARRVPLIQTTPVAPPTHKAAAIRRLQRWGPRPCCFPGCP